MKRYAQIAFEGPIAAGKTTVATMLAEYVNGLLLLEDFQGNEFLADFYRDRDRWAFPMQLGFMVTRSLQLNSIPEDRLRSVIVDYSYLKDSMFARVLLKDRELRLYQAISRGLNVKLAPPDLIVYLDATNDVLLERILRRGRPYERAIDELYLDMLRDAYEKEFESVNTLRLLRYDTSRLDLKSEKDMTELYETILAAAP
jgi:deoxyguanosine kinase